ncbi:DUF1488 family protein [Paraburkholderia sp. C35]|uniref:DUF1488 family protein n=1 Tax=Paraburkholderia sp. C35 TaxID=2126993 RepID=UPI000D696620|nr:DUF1488 family protein [Paraburkholderia sp. C35]
MEILQPAPQVLENRRGVAFGVVHGNTTIDCVISLTALETYFWLEPGASHVQILKTFENGHARIEAIAERKLRAHPATRLELKSDDFARS